MRKKVYGSPAFACVNARGTIKVDTVCPDRESAEAMLFDGDLQGRGYKVRRVRVMLETVAPRKKEK